MDLEFDFKGDPIGGVISNCKYHVANNGICKLLCLVLNFKPTFAITVFGKITCTFFSVFI